MSYPVVSLFAVMAVPLVLLISALVFKRANTPRAKMPLWASLGHALLVIAVIALAVTSLAPIWRGATMNGWLLLLHAVIAAPLLLIGLLLVMAWGGRVFSVNSEPAAPSVLSRLVFGLFGGLGLLTAGTVLTAMLPVLGYDSLLRAIDLHRWAGLGFVVLTMVYLYMLWSRR